MLKKNNSLIACLAVLIYSYGLAEQTPAGQKDICQEYKNGLHSASVVFATASAANLVLSAYLLTHSLTDSNASDIARITQMIAVAPLLRNGYYLFYAAHDALKEAQSKTVIKHNHSIGWQKYDEQRKKDKEIKE